MNDSSIKIFSMNLIFHIFHFIALPDSVKLLVSRFYDFLRKFTKRFYVFFNKVRNMLKNYMEFVGDANSEKLIKDHPVMFKKFHSS